MRWSPFLLAAVVGSVSAANPDGRIDATFGDDGRSVFGFLQSDHVQLRAIVKGTPAEGDRIWMFAEDNDDPAAFYVVKMSADGEPDANFGPDSDGRRRNVLPAALIPQAEALRIDGAVLQADGKPLVFGGLRAIGADTGVYPAFVCRLNAAGLLDGTYGVGGCRTMRSFIADDETCRATDVARAPDGAAVVIGNCIAHDRAEQPFITRLTSTGGVDLEFGAGAGLITPPAPLASITAQHFEAVVVRPDGRIAVLGDYMMFSNSVADLELGISQFDGGGSPDTSFGGNGFRSFVFDLGGDNADHARDLALRADGRLLALGEATHGQPPRTHAMFAGMLADGSIDPSVGVTGQRVEDFDDSLGLDSKLATLEFDDRDRAVIAARQVEGNPDAVIHTGRDFWVGFIRSVAPVSVFRLVITSDAATSGMVSNASEGIAIPFTVAAGSSTEIELPPAMLDEPTSDVILPLAIHVTALTPVSVVAVTGRVFSVDSYVVTPTPELGREFRVMAWGEGIGLGSQVAVSAPFDDTQLWITPTITIDGHPAGVPYPVTLQQGETYHLAALALGDLTGTRVSSSRPIQVISGHSCGQIPADIDFCDQMTDTQLPLDTWGTQFVAVPDPSVSDGELVRVLAHESDTRVWFDGVSQAVLDAGETFAALRTTPTVVTTSKPAAAASYGIGCKNHEAGEGQCPGDPSMLILPPQSQWAQRQHLVVPTDFGNNPHTERVTLVVPSDAVDSVFVDDIQVPAAAFTPSADGDFATTSFLPGPGAYTLRAARPFFAQVSSTILSERFTHGLIHAPQLEVSNDTGSADDVVMRLDAGLGRDETFGVDGIITIDHTAYFGSSSPTRDDIVRAIPDAAGIVVGSAVRNADSGQDLLMAYRIAAGSLFRDGFED